MTASIETIKDSRVNVIMLNLNIMTNASLIANNYATSASKISDAQVKKCVKYNNLKQTIKESYLSGSAKYGNNFIM